MRRWRPSQRTRYFVLFRACAAVVSRVYPRSSKRLKDTRRPLVKFVSNPLAILVFAFFALQAQAQLAVSGRVVDETGAGISGARVTARTTDGNVWVVA